jgi:hypothetical protein
VEAPVQHPADAPPQATAAWDASAFARPDAAADAVHREVRPLPADDAEKSADRVRDALARDACRRSAHQAAPASEPHVEELCTPAGARSAERSCAAPEAPEPLDAPSWEPPVERSPKPQALPQMKRVRLATASPDVPAARRLTMELETILLQARLPGAQEQPGPPEPQPPALPERPLPALAPQVFLPEHAQLAAPSDAALPAVPQLPYAA